MPKYTSEFKQQVIISVKNGMSQRKAGWLYDISPATVNRWCNESRYRDEQEAIKAARRRKYRPATVVYLSGPITLGDKNHNWEQAAEAHKLLVENHYAVINPMNSIKYEWSESVPWFQWLLLDEALITRCDLVVLLPGESRGAERECEFARQIGIPVFSLDEALAAKPRIAA